MGGWWGQGWGDALGQGAEDKLALRDANVGDLEARVVDLEVLVEEDVEVDIPRTLVDDFLTS